jgi:parvulin-like peptidyl-prolyl isomerase
VFFDVDRKEPDAETALSAARAALEADAGAPAGDRTALPAELREASAGDVTKAFGEEFAKALSSLEVGVWAKVRSSFGLHLVRVEARKPGGVPELAAVRKAVESDFARARSRESVEKFYQDARARYDVRIEPGAADAAGAAAATKRTPPSTP